MKIFIVSDAWHPQVNGVVRTYEHLGEELTRRGHEVRVIGPCDFPIRFPLPGYAEIDVAFMPYRRLSAMIEDFAPDHIHISTEGPLGCAGRRFCLRHGRSFSTAYHTHFPDYIAKRVDRIAPVFRERVRLKIRNMIRKFHMQSDAMMVATPGLEADLRRWGFGNPMYRLTRGVDLDLFSPGGKMLFQDLKRPVALYVGRIAVEKNIGDFMQMDWSGSKVLVGDGPARAALERSYPEAVFAGIQQGEALVAHYRSADLFVFPSRTDTFGMVLIEALACGLPVAGYNVTGPKDIVTEDFLGAVHGDDLALAARTALECGVPEACARHARSVYTWEKVGAQFEEMLFSKSLL